ncbi:MAG: alpha/beta fold hydrolase [Acidimicrobiales bacterium]
MSEYVDWPVETDDVTGLAILLPGRNYPATMPLLTFAGQAAAQRGWRVRAVSWRAPETDSSAMIDWVGSQLMEAVGTFDSRVLVIGKSLGTCSAKYASRLGYDAIWLTPLLHLPEVVDAMTHFPGRQLLIGGTRDSVWDRYAAHATGGDVIEIEGGDHGMFAHDAVRSAELHVEITRAIDQWLQALR